MNTFSRGDIKGFPSQGDRLGTEAFQVHLYPALDTVKISNMAEVGDIKVPICEGVDVVENVEIKAGGDLFAVIVGGVQYTRVLGLIDTDEQSPIITAGLPHMAEKITSGSGLEIANG